MSEKGTAVATVEQKPEREIDKFRRGVDAMDEQFKFALPKHIPVERFKRVVMTAVQGNPLLLNATRDSLFGACVKAAQDGLLPDGREGAIVPFKGDAQWLPMIAGILKKVRNSGELRTIMARIVHEGEPFRYWVDEKGEHIEHLPDFEHEPGPMRLVYAMATTGEGDIYLEVMTKAQVERVRAASRSKSGPWFDWYDEMAKKTAIRRLAKRLPMSSDLDDLMRRDDVLYDFSRPQEEGKALPRATGARTLAAFAGVERQAIPDERSPGKEPLADEGQGGAVERPVTAAETGGDRNGADGRDSSATRGSGRQDDADPAPARGVTVTQLERARERARKDHAAGLGRKAIPREYLGADRKQERDSWLDEWDAAEVDSNQEPDMGEDQR